MDYGINVHFFEDNRSKNLYIPSIKPYLIFKWLEKNPELAAKLDFCSTPEQYFDSPEKDVIEEIQAFCESKNMGIGCKM